MGNSAHATNETAAISPMSMGWATSIMANDTEERAVVTASMNGIGPGIVAGAQVSQQWDRRDLLLGS